MGALSRALTLALSVGLVGCTVQPLSLTLPGSSSTAQDVSGKAPESTSQQVLPAATKDYGWLNLSIRWPERDESGYQVSLLPTTTSAIAVWIKNDAGVIGEPTLITRASGSTKATTSIQVEAADNLSVEIKAYREASPDLDTAIPIAQNSGVVNVKRSKVTPLSITLVPLNFPTVGGFSQNHGRAGDTVTITGTNFGTGNVPVSVSFNGVAAQVATRVSETALSVVVPTGALTGNVVVKADGVASESNATFWVLSTLGISAIKPGWDTGPSTRYPVLYGQALQFQHLAAWALKTGETAEQYGVAPGVSWSSTNPTAGSIDAAGRFTAGATHASASVTATLGSVTSTVQAVAVGVDGVSLDKSSLTLNAPASDGSADSGYVTTGALTATVTTTLPFNNGVTWSSADESRVTVSAAGRVEVRPAAPEGMVVVTAVAKDDPTKQATASVTVTNYGGLVLGIQ